MTVFKTFMKILYRYKIMIIINLGILIFIAGVVLKTPDKPSNFQESRPTIHIINDDKHGALAKDLVDHMYKYCDKADIENNHEAIQDAFFYRILDYILIIPENYTEDFLEGKDPPLEIKSTEEYASHIADLSLNRYINTAKNYLSTANTVEELIDYIDTTLSVEAKVNLAQINEVQDLSNVAYYFNFLNYSILAGSIYSIGMILESFREDKIRKRTAVSSMKERKFNRLLILSNGAFSLVIWLFYILLGFVLLGGELSNRQGGLFIINSLIFNFSALTLAFFIANLVKSKEAINGLSHVIALGSSFFAGAFIPREFLPEKVLNFSKISPSYWYINANEIIKDLVKINSKTLRPIYINMAVILGFSILFILLANLISRRNRVFR